MSALRELNVLLAQDFFHQCLHLADQAVMRATPDQLKNETPCSEWNLRELLQHMVYELVWVPDLLAGKTIEEIGSRYDGDLLGQDPKAAWRDVCSAALGVVCHQEGESSIVHLSYADVPCRHYMLEAGTDMLVHGWDVAKSLVADYEVDEDLAAEALAFVGPREDEFRASGLFGKKVTVDDNASAWHKLLAFYGRKP